jgi:hypothetical protein
MKVSFDTIIVVIFYLILIGVITFSFNRVLDSQTAFEEYETLNDTKIPSFTLCPYPMYNDPFKNIETFEEAMIAIENAKNDYSIQMTWAKPLTKR